MNQVPAFRMRPAALSRVRIEGGFWGARMETNRSVTLALEYDQLKKTGRIDQFKMRWRPGMAPVPHKFWTAQTAKWIEAAAYSLIHHPDPALERRLDRLIGEMARRVPSPSR
ncbi:MAG: glycoside hydrolase family 127 protein [Candidatus Sumerlaeota bacterium]|nr:glycoside hydrolase family 127 protein [Candidatus Sumerlaeota bacterium]